MTQHYAFYFISDEHKNAFNVLMTQAVFFADNPETSSSAGQPLNPSGDWLQPITHWYGGAWLPTNLFNILNDLPSNVPQEGWPIMGVSGPVTLSEATAAAAVGMIYAVSKEEVDLAEDVNPLREAVFSALNLQLAEEPPP